MPIYNEKTSLVHIKIIAHAFPQALVLYAARTCWWCIVSPQDGLNAPGYQKGGTPCDPRGSVLFETHDLAGFLRSAEENPDHYGKHGIKAFVAAYHGNVMADNGYPTSFETWDTYNALIDAAQEESNS